MADVTAEDFFNKNHGKGGRFTSGGGASSGSSHSGRSAQAKANEDYKTATRNELRVRNQVNKVETKPGSKAEAAGQDKFYKASDRSIAARDKVDAAKETMLGKARSRVKELKKSGVIQDKHLSAKKAAPLARSKRTGHTPRVHHGGMAPSAYESMPSRSGYSAEGSEDFFNPYHGPDGRFTSGGGKALRGALKQMKSGQAGKRKNAAEAGVAKRKGDAAGVLKNAHAAKVQRGREQSARTKVRSMREAQIATAKRKLAGTKVAAPLPAAPKNGKVNKAKAANEARAMDRSPSGGARKSGDIVQYGKRHLNVMDVVNKHKTAKSTLDKKDDAPAARALAKMRQKQIASAKAKSKANKAGKA